MHIAAWYINLRKTQTHFEKMKISSNFTLQLSVLSFFMKTKTSTPFSLFYYFEVFKTDFNIMWKSEKRMEPFCLLKHFNIDLSNFPITLSGKWCDFEGKYVVFESPVSQKWRPQPIYFILDSLSTPINVPYTKCSGNVIKNFNHNASTLRVRTFFHQTF